MGLGTFKYAKRPTERTRRWKRAEEGSKETAKKELGLFQTFSEHQLRGSWWVIAKWGRGGAVGEG